jgi:hypothetical protein
MTGKRSVLLSLSRLCGRVCIILLIAAGFVEHQLRVVHHGLLFTPNSEAETGVLSSAPVPFAEAGKATWAHDPPRRPQARPPAARPGLQGARAPARGGSGASLLHGRERTTRQMTAKGTPTPGRRITKPPGGPQTP